MGKAFGRRRDFSGCISNGIVVRVHFKPCSTKRTSCLSLDIVLLNHVALLQGRAGVFEEWLSQPRCCH